ncbi:hypothetical protein [Streptomyces sp. NPDC060366]|uniref:hypothetical protein n=1 Tax=Streptomyces sp. NPDC060366 TaxID=3347105 RepID=UPI003665FF38
MTTSPADELRTAAFQLRNPFHLPGLKVAVDPDLATPLADWLDHAADSATASRIHGTGLAICETCCEEMPCQHVRPALAVARQINTGGTP